MLFCNRFSVQLMAVLTSMLATVGKTGAPTNGNISIVPATTATTKKGKKKYAYYNKAEQRLDEPLPPKDPAAVASLEARMKKLGKKMCNHWYVQASTMLATLVLDFLPGCCLMLLLRLKMAMHQ